MRFTKPFTCSFLITRFFREIPHSKMVFETNFYELLAHSVTASYYQINGSGTCFYLLFSSVNKGFQRKSVLAFRFIFIIDFYKMKVPLLQTNLIVLERILVVSEIVTKPDTWCIKTFKHLSHFLYLMRPIFVIISCCDKTESDKKNFSSC